MSNSHYSVVIIGSGPAGYTAAIYAARAGLKPVMFTGVQIGGQLTTTTDVENYPGYPNGVMGPQMMEDFRQQAARFGTQILYKTVTQANFTETTRSLVIEDEQTITADAVIIATGASAKWLGLESEKRLNGSGVSACAVCDGFFYRGQDVAVVGGGDTAAEEATYLAKLCKSVQLFVRTDKMRASKVMQQRVFNTPNITVHWNTVTEAVLGENAVEGVRVRNTQTNVITEHPITGFFVAIGHQPNTSIFVGQLELNENGYIITKPGSTYTSKPGVFACGDVQDHVYRQAVTAAGTGCMAALDAERWLAAQGLH